MRHGSATAVVVGGLLVGTLAAISLDIGQADIAGDVRVIDGDTIELAGERIRLDAIDAAELHGDCYAETVLADAAKRRLSELFAGNHAVDVQRHGTDIYGRTLARVTVNGQDVATVLLGEGLVAPWEGYRADWCHG